MRKIREKLIIFSVYQDSQHPLDNLKEHTKTKLILMDIGVDVTEVEGAYMGTTERSLIVNAKHHDLVLFLADSHNQESVLEIEHDLSARLLYLDGRRDDLGYMVQIPSEDLAKHDSYTYNPANNTAWITKAA